MMKITKPPIEYVDRFEPGPIVGAEKALAGILGSFGIAHGVVGCTSLAMYMRGGGPVVDGYYSPLAGTGLQRVEIIHGQNEELLMRAIRYRWTRSGKTPRIGFILTTCASSIIEDDIRRVADQAEEELGIPFIAIDTAGFMGGFNRGAEWVWTAVMDRFAIKAERQEGINIVGPQLMGSNNWPNDIQEILRLLRAADVKVNMPVFWNTPVEGLTQIANAEANYLLTSESFPDFEEKSNSLGLRVIGQDRPLPIGIHNTEEWYIALAREFGDVEKAKVQLQADMDRVARIMKGNYNASWALAGISGKHVGILGYANFAASLARALFYDLNLRPTVIGLWGETPESLERAEKLLEPMSELADFEVLENPSYYAYGQKLKEAEVDFSIGMMQDKALVEGLGIAHCRLSGFYFYNNFDFVPWPYFGVLGMLNLVSKIWNTLEQGV
ncbi:MAG: hypothetical protein HY664_05100, partial [Chloroflexi bacterium]|nr:hypothetical protein [Chloroflexota bacterium]